MFHQKRNSQRFCQSFGKKTDELFHIEDPFRA